jgi:hypothetical protein
MPRFDLPDRKGPAKVVLYPHSHERVFVLPCDTEDPADIALLRKHPLLRESAIPALKESQSPKPPKEV